MSAIVLLPVVLPAATAAWPLIAAAATAAAGALGYAASRRGTDDEAETGVTSGRRSVNLEGTKVDAVAATLGRGQELVFSKGTVRIVFSRDASGKTAVRVCGEGHSEAELRQLGEAFANRIVQQYAYNRIVTELKSRNGTIVDQQVDEDGTVRLQVRVFHG